MRISVVIPCYNYARFLEQAIQSVIKQSVKPNEIIVMDDCSKDDPFSICKNYEVTYVRNQYNLGAPANFNRGVSIATGDYIFLLGADNFIDHFYIEKLAKPLRKKDVAISYSHVYLFGDAAKKHVENSRWWDKGIDNGKYYRWVMPRFNPDLLKEENYINGSAMFKKQAWKDVGGYKQMKRAEDWQLWQDMVSKGWKAELVPEFLLYYRQWSVTEQRNSTHNPNIKNYNKER